MVTWKQIGFNITKFQCFVYTIGLFLNFGINHQIFILKKMDIDAENILV